MARIRSIKPSFWTDAHVAALPIDARLMLVGLISMADDDGRFLATATAIGGYVFPYDEMPHPKIRKLRDLIAKSGVIDLYTVDGLDYGWFPKWTKHQKVYKHYPSTFPPPPGWVGNQS